MTSVQHPAATFFMWYRCKPISYMNEQERCEYLRYPPPVSEEGRGVFTHRKLTVNTPSTPISHRGTYTLKPLWSLPTASFMQNKWKPTSFTNEQELCEYLHYPPPISDEGLKLQRRVFTHRKLVVGAPYTPISHRGPYALNSLWPRS